MPEHDDTPCDFLAYLEWRLGQDADDAPVIGPAHREEQVESIMPEVDVELARHHGARHGGVGHEEHVLVGRVLKLDAVQLAHCAPGTIAATGSSRNAILSVIAFFAVGAAILAFVDVEQGQEAAREDRRLDLEERRRGPSVVE